MNQEKEVADDNGVTQTIGTDWHLLLSIRQARRSRAQATAGSHRNFTDSDGGGDGGDSGGGDGGDGGDSSDGGGDGGSDGGGDS